MKKSEQTYKIEFNHKEMKNIEFCNILNVLDKEYNKLVLEQNKSNSKFSSDRIGYCQSAISLLIRNFIRLEKEFRNEIKEVA